MSLLLLFRNSGPVTQAGYRSLFAFWLGGACVSITPTGQPFMKRLGGVPGMRINRGVW
jgi:hypothetical protein